MRTSPSYLTATVAIALVALCGCTGPQVETAPVADAGSTAVSPADALVGKWRFVKWEGTPNETVTFLELYKDGTSRISVLREDGTESVRETNTWRIGSKFDKPVYVWAKNEDKDGRFFKIDGKTLLFSTEEDFSSGVETGTLMSK